LPFRYVAGAKPGRIARFRSKEVMVTVVTKANEHQPRVVVCMPVPEIDPVPPGIKKPVRM